MTVPPAPLPSRQPGFVGALVHAWDGLVWAASQQRNMKVHVVSAMLVGCVGSALPLGLAEKVTLVFSVMLIFFSEVVNSALEALVDLHTERFHELARVAKDTAAAGVLVLSIGTVALFATILVNDWPLVAAHPREVLRQLAVGTPLCVLGGCLPWKRPRAKMVDVSIFLAAAALWAWTLSWTTSAVFSAMILGLLLLQAAAARALRWR